MSKIKTAILDIETAPNLAWVWRFFKENVGAKQVVEHSEILSFAYKWHGDSSIHYYDVQHSDELDVLKKINSVLDEADIVVAHNGTRFDLPTIQGRALVNGLKPPSPYKQVDTLKVAKSEFRFPSNSLEYLAKVLGVEEKGGHKEFPGFELWAECMKGNPKAWEEMREYNIQDVVVLEQVYDKMRPYMRNHPNVAVFSDEEETCCPRCGGNHLHRRGFSYTNVGKYQRFVCNDCGSWSRTRFTEHTKSKSKSMVVNAVN